MPDIKDGYGGMERHIQTGIQLVIIAILVWFGNRVIQTSEVVVRLDERTTNISSKLDKVEKEVSNNATSAETRMLRNSIDGIERRLQQLEYDHRKNFNHLKKQGN